MISVIIPTYKNKEILLKNLKHNLRFLNSVEIIVINDDPKESLKDYLLKKKIILIENKKNLGFGQSVNLGVQKARNQFVMLLNTDVRLINNSYKSAIKFFIKDPSLFAVAFAQKEKNGDLVGKNEIYWQQGMIFHKKANNLIFGETAWAEGGACLIDRNKFVRLGGFDPIYYPFYWEDIDLSYRAKKAGYKIIFDPTIKVIHHHESTIGKYYPQFFIEKVAFRNQLLFIWKNINDPKKKLSHFLYLPYHLLRYIVTGKINYLLGFIEAVKKII